MNQFVGREEELGILNSMKANAQADFVAVLGRRRVGKTFLIKTAFRRQIDFQYTGVKQISKAEQLLLFDEQLANHSKVFRPKTRSKSWLEAFTKLKTYLARKSPSKKKIVFLDELPWMASSKSGFMPALENFWNSWAVDQNILLIVCGSASNWMIKHIINNKAGLHNRITKYIHLAPFSLKETEIYFKANKINLSRYEIILIYMAMGGIPHYLKEVQKGRSAIQNIDRICFSKTGLLRTEFTNLYRALFDHHEKYEIIIKTLSSKQKGLTRKQILKDTKFTNGGGLTRMLRELEECSFVASYLPFGKTERDTIYRLVDEYSLFYHNFIKNNKTQGAGSWIQLSQGARYKAWSGYAFEGICLKHMDSIKSALGIRAIYTEASSYIARGATNVQIDLVLDRADNIINIFEIKFYNKAFTLTKSEADKIRKRKMTFINRTKTKKHIFVSLICTYEPNNNKHLEQQVDQVLLLDDLFH